MSEIASGRTLHVRPCEASRGAVHYERSDDLMERWQEHFATTVFHRSADTAHDLKTPLNIGVLNLELLRMRTRKLHNSAEDDEKIEGYARAIDTELRRLATIFDAFFVYSVPPRGEEVPVSLDTATALADAADRAGVVMQSHAPVMVFAHRSRINTLGNMFFGGISRLVDLSQARISFSVANGSMMLQAEGALTNAVDELARVFKFYYTDPTGAPELSLAISRLIAETYGGGITAVQHDDTAVIELTLPVEER